VFLVRIASRLLTSWSLIHFFWVLFLRLHVIVAKSISVGDLETAGFFLACVSALCCIGWRAWRVSGRADFFDEVQVLGNDF
jgi:hypothetical protein